MHGKPHFTIVRLESGIVYKVRDGRGNAKKLREEGKEGQGGGGRRGGEATLSTMCDELTPLVVASVLPR
jgi:hypothetical protein